MRCSEDVVVGYASVDIQQLPRLEYISQLTLKRFTVRGIEGHKEHSAGIHESTCLQRSGNQPALTVGLNIWDLGVCFITFPRMNILGGSFPRVLDNDRYVKHSSFCGDSDDIIDSHPRTLIDFEVLLLVLQRRLSRPGSTGRCCRVDARTVGLIQGRKSGYPGGYQEADGDAKHISVVSRLALAALCVSCFLLFALSLCFYANSINDEAFIDRG